MNQVISRILEAKLPQETESTLEAITDALNIHLALDIEHLGWKAFRSDAVPQGSHEVYAKPEYAEFMGAVIDSQLSAIKVAYVCGQLRERRNRAIDMDAVLTSVLKG